MNNCGLFNVSTSFMNGEVDNECVIVLVLTVGGTGIPLLTIILCLLCTLCCVCRRLSRGKNKSFDLTKTDEANGGSNMVDTGGVQIKELHYVVDEDMAGPLYDEVKRVEEITIAVDDIDPKSKLEEIPEDMLPQPYEEISVGKRQDPPPQLPDYATPEGILSVPDSAIKRASIPPKVDDYSSLFEDLKEESVSTRNSMSLLPEGMYSSIGDICAPPLPPPLASEHVPIEIRESLDNLADKEAKQYKGLGSQEELSKTVADQIPINDHEQVLADAIEEMEKFASNDVTDGDAPSYTNITYQQNDGHTSREKLNINESEVSYYNTSHKLIASQEEEVEIKQDLYVNI